MKKIILLLFIISTFSCYRIKEKIPATKAVEINYGKDIERYAKTFQLSPEYLKALAVLECSGKKNIKARFEQGVYDKLIDLKNNKTEKFENISPELLKNTPDTILRDMATSWGALQIMGYKCVFLNIDINELKGEHNLFYSIKWIDETYGDYVREGKFKDAFHIHNAGKIYPDTGVPLTFDPNYVPNGLKYYKYFKKKSLRKENSKISFKIKANEVFQKKD